MSILNESIDYNNTLLTWKLPPKKSIDFKSDNSVNILVATSQHNHVEMQQNNLHTQDSILSKQYTHYATIQDHNLSNQTGMIISHIPNHVNGNIQLQQFKPNENIHLQQVIPRPTQNIIHFQTEPPPLKSNIPKEKNTVIKKKVKKIPVDGITYHSKQLGLRVPPKKVISMN